MRPDVEALLTDRTRRLPVDETRGYPVPWFVPIIDGRPEFRVADRAKYVRAVRENLCWVCGQPLGRFRSFVIGPMCSVNRIAGDPPSHIDCAEFAVRACPFLVRPDMDRRTGGRPGVPGDAFGGVMLDHNPGVSLVWTTRDAHLVDDGQGGRLFQLGEPESVTWWREGRPATRAEVLAGMALGFPKLVALCDGPDDEAELERLRARAERYLPAGTE